jgi:hypothetical protein
MACEICQLVGTDKGDICDECYDKYFGPWIDTEQ